MTVTVTGTSETSQPAPSGSTLGPCVSLATGTLSPDLRVNYAYGMVLGLDEFLQEQLHNLSKDYLHERALHGYGTVSGLAVSTEAVTGAKDFRISVTQGIAIDQWGREIVLRCDQCVQVGSWVAAQEDASPGILAKHLLPSGEVTVYVVASYAECLDRLVPLPGQPCSSSDQVTVASRIRDAWDLELRWDPPPMPRWDSDRRLARLLDDVSIVAGLDPAKSDEKALTDAVRALSTHADDGPDSLDPTPTPPAGGWKIPAETAAAALDRILTVWVTQVRPGLHPDLVEPEAAFDPAILLSTVTFTPAEPFKTAAPVITACTTDDDGRPYLLHTQLIQELHWLSDAIAGAKPVDEHTFATLAPTIDAKDELTVDAWFHPLKPVRLPEAVKGTDEDATDLTFRTRAINPDTNGFSAHWQLLAPPTDGGAATGSAQLSVVFTGADVLIGDAATSLAQAQKQGGLSFIDADPATGDVTAYGIVPPAIAPPKPTYPAEFVTLTELEVNPKYAVVELWFHSSPHGLKSETNVDRPSVAAYDDVRGNALKMTLTGQSSANVWNAQIMLPTARAGGSPLPLYIRWRFPTADFGLSGPTGTPSLEEYIQTESVVFEGYEPAAKEIIAFSRVGVPAVVRQG